MRDTFLIKKPLITEKSSILNETGKYVFIVKPSATKNEIKKALKDIYRVDVVAVNMINLPDKPRKFRGKESMKPGIKKAIVTLKEGQKIDLAR